MDHGPLERAHLPYPVVLAAVWSACLLLIVGGGWVVAQAVGRLSVVVAPLAIAVLLAAMLRPLVDRLDRFVPRALAAVTVVVGLIGLIVGGLVLVTTQVIGGFAGMADSLRAGADSLLEWLSDGPLHLTADRLAAAVGQVRSAIENHPDALAAGAWQFGHTAVDAVAGTLICLIALFFLLYHGERLWAFFVRWLPAAGRERVHTAFRSGWTSLGAYTRTQLTVAVINAAGVGIGAAVLRVPFLVPIVVVVFLCSFVPIIGTLVSGIVPALIALVDRGPWVALAMVVIVFVVHELEAHVLQPFLMGHAVALHPLAVIVVVASGTYLFGIVGALFAVPAAALVNSVVRSLTGPELPTRAMGPDPEPEPAPESAQSTESEPATDSRSVPVSEPTTRTQP